MKFLIPMRFFTLATLAITSLLPFTPAKAGTFEETDIDQTEVIAVARPYGENKFDLLIIQQIPGKNKCWEEVGSNPVIIDPLLLNFDFSGHCNRATDSNGYSIRIDGQDYGLDLLLRLVPQDGELVLVGSPRRGGGSDIVIGRTYGLQRNFMKIVLDPGWKFSKRTYQDKVLGHFYFSGTQTAIYNNATPTANPDNLSSPEEMITPETQDVLPDSLEGKLTPDNQANPPETLNLPAETLSN